MYLIRAIDTPWRKKSFLKFFQNILLVSFNCLLGTTSHASLDCSALKPYGGLEYVQRSLVFKEGYGKGDFNQRLPQAHVFLGIQINDYLGLEAGYLFSQAVTRTSFAENRQALGEFVDPGDDYVAENKINLTGPQMSVVGRLPFGASGFSALGSIGVSWLNLQAIHKRITFRGIPLTPLEVLQSTRHFSVKKVVPKWMFGLGYQLTDSIGMRVLMGYEKTSQFKNITPKESKILSITLKNATLFSIGFTANF